MERRGLLETSGSLKAQVQKGGGAFPPPLVCNRCVSSGTYIPRKEVVVLETIKATVIRENQAIRLRARKEGMDRGGVHRVTGKEG